ncbi:MAG: S-adenosylmethionine:tRNA ribosyltransferase-isomerase [Prevotellaceae bacterium]|nr:S-adenosylmethionine:tRNA ribosyltransferase-isomerase [Prevotellaceae bacterium]
MKPSLPITDYTYDLPDEKIACFPEIQRDRSKLLYYNNGTLRPYQFFELTDILPNDSLLVFNNTKVIPARLLFRKESYQQVETSGALIEVFCLEPVEPANYEQCFGEEQNCVWKCTVGNLKRWKNTHPLHKTITEDCILTAKIIEIYKDCLHIKFNWTGGYSFARIMELGGAMPIPPYLKREATEEDSRRYQTIYALHKGSVAAPTAGLHFTDDILTKLKNSSKAKLAEITLHVGAGTFRPVKTTTIDEHIMHSEPFSINKDTLQLIAHHKGPLIAVGTTSARTLESLYYLGCRCLRNEPPIMVEQWEPYIDNDSINSSFINHNSSLITPKDAIEALISYLEQQELDTLYASTQILIAPSYRFKLINGLITNFHQPQSTLLLLIAAFIGNDWKKVYEYALNHHFRFLSYGDSSLLIP